MVISDTPVEYHGSHGKKKFNYLPDSKLLSL